MHSLQLFAFRFYTEGFSLFANLLSSFSQRLSHAWLVSGEETLPGLASDSFREDGHACTTLNAPYLTHI